MPKWRESPWPGEPRTRREDQVALHPDLTQPGQEYECECEQECECGKITASSCPDCSAPNKAAWYSLICLLFVYSAGLGRWMREKVLNGWKHSVSIPPISAEETFLLFIWGHSLPYNQSSHKTLFCPSKTNCGWVVGLGWNVRDLRQLFPNPYNGLMPFLALVQHPLPSLASLYHLFNNLIVFFWLCQLYWRWWLFKGGDCLYSLTLYLHIQPSAWHGVDTQYIAVDWMSAT